MNIKNLEEMVSRYNQALESGKVVELVYNESKREFSVSEFVSIDDHTMKMAFPSNDDTWFVSSGMRRFYFGCWGNCEKTECSSMVTVENVITYFTLSVVGDVLSSEMPKKSVDAILTKLYKAFNG